MKKALKLVLCPVVLVPVCICYVFNYLLLAVWVVSQHIVESGLDFLKETLER